MGWQLHGFETQTLWLMEVVWDLIFTEMSHQVSQVIDSDHNGPGNKLCRVLLLIYATPQELKHGGWLQ